MTEEEVRQRMDEGLSKVKPLVEQMTKAIMEAYEFGFEVGFELGCKCSKG